MRTKIQNSFHELPEPSHVPLRDSIVSHIEHITPETNPIITKQLALALADLILLMGSWQKPIECLLEKFASSSDSIQPLLITLTYVPEEIDSRYLRLGDNRRKQILKELDSSSSVLLGFLQNCLVNNDSAVVQRIHYDVITCFTSWVKMRCIATAEAASSMVFSYAFQILMNTATSTQKQMDIACDCICGVLESIDAEKITPELEREIFGGIMQLDRAYHESVSQEDSDKSMVLCRVFTVVAETYLGKMINGSAAGAPHYSVEVLDRLIMCVGHFDFEVAQITFNVWYRLSEELYDKNDDALTSLFEKYVERLIEVLYKHCQQDADHEGLIDDDDSFSVSFVSFLITKSQSNFRSSFRSFASKCRS
jgi:transportin-3